MTGKKRILPNIFVALSATANTSALVLPRTFSSAVGYRVGNNSDFSPPLHMSVGPPPLREEIKSELEDFDITLQEQIEAFDPSNLKQESSNSVIKQGAQDEEEDIDHDVGIWAARALLLVVAMLWGTNFASVKYLETLCFHPPCNHPPSEAAFARFGVAALVSLPLLIGQRKDVILGGMECGLWIGFGYIAQAMALETIGAGKCAFICSLTVVIVPLLSALFFGKKIKPINVVSAAIAMTGVGVLEGLVDVSSLVGIQTVLTDSASNIATVAPDIISSSSSLVTASTAVSATDSTGWLASAANTLSVGKGDLLALGQPFGFGFSFMRIEYYVEKFHDVENRVLTISAAQCLIVGLLATSWVLYDYRGVFPDLDYLVEPHRIVTIAWTGIMTTVVAIYLEGVALETASATEAALTFASEPVWASLFGAWLLHEKLGQSSYVGGAIILTACIISAVADLPQLAGNGRDIKYTNE